MTSLHSSLFVFTLSSSMNVGFRTIWAYMGLLNWNQQNQHSTEQAKARDLFVILKMQVWCGVIIEEMLMEKSGFMRLVRASIDRAWDCLATISGQLNKAEFMCTGRWDCLLFNKNWTRAIQYIYSTTMGLERAYHQIFIVYMVLHLTVLAVAIIITSALMAAFILPW